MLGESATVKIIVALLLVMAVFVPVASAAGGDAVMSLDVEPVEDAERAAVSDGEYVRVDRVSGDRMLVTFTSGELTRLEVVRDEGIFNLYSMAGMTYTKQVGKPQLPYLSRHFAVPTEAVSIQVVEADSYETYLGHVYPAQQPRYDVIGEDEREYGFDYDAERYSSDEFYPGSPVELHETGMVRQVPFARLGFFPVLYNPSTGFARVYTQVQVEVSWRNELGFDCLGPLSSRSFESVYGGIFTNWDDVSGLFTRPASTAARGADVTGCEYLIISHPDFLPAANALRDWKIERGIDTVVVDTIDTGTTSADIRQYIANAYNNWTVPPSYVLLVGDAEFIPTNYYYVHSYYGYETGTDLWYATVAGSDYIPDISMGRIPVDTLAQAQAYIQKIIDYETDPPTNSQYYQNITVAAYFQDPGGDGYEDRRFVRTSEEVRDYLLTQSFDVERIYCTGASITPTNYNNGLYGSGEPLPPELLRANGFAWDGDGTDIINAVNSGTFLLNHRDHGSRLGWGDPHFQTPEVAALNNGDLHPIVMSINCETGWFDHETDPSSSTTTESFCEEFVRKDPGGTVCIFGASRVSYSGYNDYMCRGFYDAIWPDFDTSQGSSVPMYRMGDVLNYGKSYMANTWGDAWGYERLEFELFHCYGDPTMEIWTAEPTTFNVTHAAAYPAGTTQIPVSVSSDSSDAPVDDVFVCVSQNGVIMGTNYSSGGVALVDTSGLTSGPLSITATKHNHRPYRGNAVTLSGDHDLVVTDMTVPSSGEAGKQVSVWANITNAGLNPETNVNVQLTIDGTVENSTVIASLPSGSKDAVFMTWTPALAGNYQVGIYAVPVGGENVTWDNYMNDTISVTAEADIWTNPGGFDMAAMTGDTDSENLTIGNDGLGIAFFNISAESSIETFQEEGTGTDTNGWYTSPGDDLYLQQGDGLVHSTSTSFDTISLFSDGHFIQFNFSGRAGDMVDINLHAYLYQGQPTPRAKYITLYGGSTPTPSTVIRSSTLFNVGNAGTIINWTDVYIPTETYYVRAEVVTPSSSNSFALDNYTITFSKNSPMGDWLSVQPGSGAVSPSNQTNVTLTANSSALSPGFYQANLTIEHNDPGIGDIIVPVNFTVLSAPHDIAVWSINVPATGEAGKSIPIEATILNQGANDETNIEVRLLVDGGQENSTTIASLTSGSQTNVTLAWIPATAGNYSVEMYAVPVSGETVTTNNILNDTISVTAEPEIWTNPGGFDFSMEMGQMGTDNLTVGNDGLATLDYVILGGEAQYPFNENSTATLSAGGASGYNMGYRFQALSPNMLVTRLGRNVPADDARWVTLWDDAGNNLAQVYVGAGSGWQWVDVSPVPLTQFNFYRVTVYCTTGYYYGSVWAGDENVATVSGCYGSGSKDTFPTTISGNFYGIPDIGYTVGGAGQVWLSVTPLNGSLSTSVTADHTVTANATSLSPGSYHENITILSNDPDEDTVEVPVNLTVFSAPHDIEVLSMSLPAFPEAGSPIPVEATIRNQGSSNENNVVVNLLVDGAVENTTTMPFILSGTETNVTLAWTPMAEATYDVEISTVPVTWENITFNNALNESLFVEANPDIWLDRYGVDIMCIVDDTDQETLLIGNSGLDPLNWQIYSGSTLIEDFPSTTLNASNWASTSGTPVIGIEGLNPPSSPYSVGFNNLDYITSVVHDLSVTGSAEISFYFERGGAGEHPDLGDHLYLDYYSSFSTWVNLWTKPGLNGSEPNEVNFNHVTLNLPANALHPNFRFRFWSDGSGPSFDDFYVDDILLSYSSMPGWLTVVPTSGNTPSSDTDTVTFIADATGLSVGSYQAVLIVLSDDPNEGNIPLPVNLTVINGTVLNANSGEWYPTITEAVSNANPFDTLEIYEATGGAYDENVVVGKQGLTLIGMQNALIDAGGAGTVLTILADDVVVDNITVTNGWEGLYVTGAYASISNVMVTSNVVGLTLDGAAYADVADSEFSANSVAGIQATDCHNCTFASLSVSGTDRAIDMLRVYDSTLSDNQLASSVASITMDECARNVLSGNVMTGPAPNHFEVDGASLQHYDHAVSDTNTVNGLPVYYYYGVDGMVINNMVGSLFLIGSDGTEIDTLNSLDTQVLLAYCTNTVVENLYMSDGSTGGLVMRESSNVTVRSASIEGVDALVGTALANCEFSDSTFSGSSDGVILVESSDISFADCDIYGVSGVVLVSSPAMTFDNCTITRNGAWVISIGPPATGPSSAVLLNTGAEPSALDILDPGATIESYYHLHVYAMDFYNGPVPGADINITDAVGGYVLPPQTDAGGWCRFVSVLEYVSDFAGTVDHMPCTVVARKGSCEGSAPVSANTTCTIAVRLLSAQPTEIAVVEVSPSSFEVSWHTEASTGGQLVWGDTPALGNSTDDFRGPAYVGENHVCVVTGLAENTTYYFRIFSGGDEYGDGDGDGKPETGEAVIGAVPWDVQTLEGTSMPPSSHVVFGEVRDAGFQPAQGTVVTCRAYQSGLGLSEPISVVADSNGLFDMNLGDLRTQGGDWFPWTPGDPLNVTLDGGLLGCEFDNTSTIGTSIPQNLGLFVIPDTMAPLADAGLPNTQRQGSWITLDGNYSWDNIGIDNYTWTFDWPGGPVTLWGVSPTFYFDEVGSFNVTLNVTDAWGNWDVDYVLVSVTPANVRNLDLNTFHDTITEGVLGAGAGDRIMVWSGSYVENVVIDRPLTLLGQGAGNTTINAVGSGHALEITSDWVNVSGFNLTGGGFGVAALQLTGGNVNVSDCDISVNFGMGANLSGCSGVEFFDCVFAHQFLDGARLDSCSDVSFTSCGFADNLDGVRSSSSVNTRIQDSTFEGGEHGMLMVLSDNFVITGCTVSNTSIAGVSVTDSRFGTITGSTLWNNLNDPLWLSGDVKDEFDHTITGNLVNGKQLLYVFDQIAGGYILYDCGQIIVAWSDYLTLSQSNADYAGLTVWYSDNFTVFDCDLQGVQAGLRAYGCGDLSVESSIVQGAFVGLDVQAGAGPFYVSDSTLAGSAAALRMVGMTGWLFNTSFDPAGIDIQGASSLYGQNTNGRTYLWGDIALDFGITETNALMDWIDPSWYGNLTVQSGGSLTLDGVRLNMNCSFDAQHAVVVENGGWLNVTNGSNVTAYTPDVFSFRVYGGMNVVDSEMSRFGTSGPALNNGIYISGGTVDIRNSRLFDYFTLWSDNSASLTLLDNVIDANGGVTVISGSFLMGNNVFNGTLTLMGGANVVEGNEVNGLFQLFGAAGTIRDNVFDGSASPFWTIYADNVAATFENCTVVNSAGHPIALDNFANVAMLNSSFDKANVVYNDAFSTLTVLWYLDVLVTDGVGVPVAGQNFSLIDASGSWTNHTTGASGRVDWIVTTEYVEDFSGATYHTPHELLVENATHYNIVNVTMDVSRYVVLPILTHKPVHNIVKDIWYIWVQPGIADADPGDAIHLWPVVHAENLVIDKPLTIYGDDAATTIIDGGNTGDVVFITAANVTLRGLTIRSGGSDPNDDCGVELGINSEGSVVADCIIADVERGIKSFSGWLTITGNIITSYSGDVWLFAGSNYIVGNTLMGEDLHVNNGDDNYIADNYVAFGLNLNGGSGSYVFNNSVNSVTMWGSSDNVFRDVTIRAATSDGVYASGGWNNVFVNCTIEETAYDDIYLISDARITLLNTSFNKSSVVVLGASTRLTVTWFLHFEARDGSGAPVPDVHVNVTDSFGSPVDYFVTEADGFSRWNVEREYEQTLAGQTFFTPHYAFGENHSHYFEAEFTMDLSKTVTVFVGWKPVHNLNVNLYYLAIAPALNEASSGDTIVLRSRTYRENLVVDRDLTLRAFTQGGPVIDGMGGTIIQSLADHLTIDGLVFVNSSVAVASGTPSKYTTGITALDCVFDLHAEGIRLEHVMSATITGCSFNDCGIGLSTNASITHVASSDFTGSGTGLVYRKSTGTIVSCSFQGASGTGIVVTDSGWPLIEGCAFSALDMAVRCQGYAAPTLRDLDVDFCDIGIGVYDGSSPDISNVTVTGALVGAILCQNGSNPVIQVSIDQSLAGIVCEGNSNATVYNSTISTVSGDIVADTGSWLTVINSQSAYDKVLDPDSGIVYKQYVAFWVADAIGAPIPGVTAEAADASGSGSTIFVTAATGESPMKPLTTHVLTSAGTDDSMNPYSVTVWDTVSAQGPARQDFLIELDYDAGPGMRDLTFNYAPTLTGKPPVLALSEGTVLPSAFTIGDYLWDVDNIAVTFSIDPYVRFSLNGSDVDVEATMPEWTGTTAIRVTGTDTYGLATSFDVNVTVLPLNDPPVIGPFPTLNPTEDVPYEFDVSPYLSDEDDLVSTLILSEDSPYATMTGHLLTLQYPEGVAGDNVTISVSDGYNTVSSVLTVSVTPVNDPPVIAGVPHVTAARDTPYVLDLAPYVSDPDTAAAGLTVTTDSSYASVNGLQVTFLYDVDGLTEGVRLMVSDGEFLAWADITVTVPEVDDSPVIAPLPTVTATEEVTYAFDLRPYITDPDDPLSDLQVFENSPYASVSGHTLLLFYPEGVTSDVVSFNVSDGTTAVGSVLVVNVTPVNDPPAVSGIPDVTVTRGEAYVLDLTPYVTDPDTPGTGLTVSADSAYASVNGLEVTFLYGTDGITEYIRLVIDDGQYSVWQDITVTVPAINDPPTVSALPVLDVEEDREYVFDLDPYLGDPDDPLSTLLVYEDSQYAVVSGRALVLLYPNGITDDVIEITVSDGTTSVNATLTVNVTPVNDPPVLAGVPHVTAARDTPYVLDLAPYVTDPDTPAAALSVSTSSASASVNGLLVTFLYDTDPLTETVRLIVSDGEYSDWIDVIVTVPAFADPPVVNPLPQLAVTEDVSYVFDLGPYLSDPDTPVMSLLVYEDSQYATVSGTSITFTYPDGITDEVVTVTVSDGTSSVTSVIQVSITPDNDALTLQPLLPVEVVQGATTVLDISQYIHDDDTPLSAMTITTSSPNVTAMGTTLVIAYGMGITDETVRVFVSDGATTVFQDLEIEVIQVAQPPRIAPLPDMDVDADTPTYISLEQYISDLDTGVTGLRISTDSTHVVVEGLMLRLEYPGSVSRETVIVWVSDGTASASTSLNITVVSPPSPPEVQYMFSYPLDGKGTYGFLVSYLDADNDMPETLYVVIDGTPHALAENSSQDTDCTDGKTYYCEVVLSPGDHTVETVVVDSSGLMTSSSPTTLSVAAPPEPTQTAAGYMWLLVLLILVVVAILLFLAIRRSERPTAVDDGPAAEAVPFTREEPEPFVEVLSDAVSPVPVAGAVTRHPVPVVVAEEEPEPVAEEPVEAEEVEELPEPELEAEEPVEVEEVEELPEPELEVEEPVEAEEVEELPEPVLEVEEPVEVEEAEELPEPELEVEEPVEVEEAEAVAEPELEVEEPVEVEEVETIAEPVLEVEEPVEVEEAEELPEPELEVEEPVEVEEAEELPDPELEVEEPVEVEEVEELSDPELEVEEPVEVEEAEELPDPELEVEEPVEVEEVEAIAEPELEVEEPVEAEVEELSQIEIEGIFLKQLAGEAAPAEVERPLEPAHARARAAVPAVQRVPATQPPPRPRAPSPSTPPPRPVRKKVPVRRVAQRPTLRPVAKPQSSPPERPVRPQAPAPARPAPHPKPVPRKRLEPVQRTGQPPRVVPIRLSSSDNGAHPLPKRVPIKRPAPPQSEAAPAKPKRPISRKKKIVKRVKKNVDNGDDLSI